MKLTEANVAEIRSLYGVLNQYELADRFDVSQGRISQILRGVAWKHL